MSQSGGDPTCNCGAIYQFVKNEGGWTANVLHNFLGGPNDGSGPASGLVQDAAGNLFGATGQGGPNNNGGTVFEFTPNGDGTFNYSVIYDFGSGSPYSAGPAGSLAIDSFGNLYGSTLSGGIYGYGAVFKLSQSGGVWTESILFNFTLEDGNYPNAYGISIDRAGNVYGATLNGGAYGVGTVYKLTPTKGYWSQTVLHTFTGGADGAIPWGTFAIDSTGAIYGTADSGGLYGYGNIFKLSAANGKWKETVLHEFTKGNDGHWAAWSWIREAIYTEQQVMAEAMAWGFFSKLCNETGPKAIIMPLH
jgi:uncharacterized repeat protein (TIGR03803 family)